jgi:hypothetical protein
MDFMAVSCICLTTLRLWLSKSAERHRRPPLDLGIVGAFAPALGDGVQVPLAGTLGRPLPLAGEFGTHMREDVPLMPFFGEFGTQVPEDVPSMPFFGFASLLGLASFLVAPPMQFASLTSQSV